MIGRTTLAALAALLAGCAHTSPTPPASMVRQAAWAADLSTSDAPIAGDWWTGFHDPALDRLMAEAQDRNLDLGIAAERVIEADALRRASAARLWPEATAQAAQSDARNGPSSATAGLALTWEPDLSGRLGAARRAADAGLWASAYDADAVRQLLLAEVATAYLEFHLQSALTGLAVRMADAQAATQDITLARFEVGVSGALDVERGARRAETQAADSRLRQAGLAYQQAMLLAMQEVQAGAAGYVQAQARTRELERAAAAARRAADLARLQYQEGALSQLDVLDAERTVFAAEEARARAGGEVSMRLVELYRAMGVAPASPRSQRSLAALSSAMERP